MSDRARYVSFLSGPFDRFQLVRAVYLPNEKKAGSGDFRFRGLRSPLPSPTTPWAVSPRGQSGTTRLEYPKVYLMGWTGLFMAACRHFRDATGR
jgi:hypothetical protein